MIPAQPPRFPKEAELSWREELESEINKQIVRELHNSVEKPSLQEVTIKFWTRDWKNIVLDSPEEIERQVREKGYYSPYIPLQRVENQETINTLPPTNNSMNTMQNDVRIFMEAGEQHTQKTAGFTPENEDAAELYMRLIDEEFRELLGAYVGKDIIGVADGAGDLIWVVMGLCNTLGINMNAVWAEITASNMSKTVDGKLIKREDGKILKPESYFRPNIAKALSLGE